MSDKDRPSAPIMYKGQHADFHGTVHLSWLRSITTGGIGIGNSSYELGTPFPLDPGIYWIVMTGSAWGYYDGESMCVDYSKDDFTWLSGTRDSNGVYDSEWGDYIKNFPTYPTCMNIFFE